MCVYLYIHTCVCVFVYRHRSRVGVDEVSQALHLSQIHPFVAIGLQNTHKDNTYAQIYGYIKTYVLQKC